MLPLPPPALRAWLLVLLSPTAYSTRGMHACILRGRVLPPLIFKVDLDDMPRGAHQGDEDDEDLDVRVSSEYGHDDSGGGLDHNGGGDADEPDLFNGTHFPSHEAGRLTLMQQTGTVCIDEWCFEVLCGHLLAGLPAACLALCSRFFCFAVPPSLWFGRPGIWRSRGRFRKTVVSRAARGSGRKPRRVSMPSLVSGCYVALISFPVVDGNH